MICVPIDAIWTIGIAIRPVKKMYANRSPSVIVPVDDRAAADEDHHDADGADDDARERRRRRDAGHRLGDVAEELVRALREDQVLAPLGRVGLDDAHAAERLVEPAGDFGR